MDATRVLGLLICVLLLGSLAHAETEIVQQTLDYDDHMFFPDVSDPEIILDHSPYYRIATEDWGWTHDMTSVAPTNATGIEWATLWIDAWDVDAFDGERDIIYVNGQQVGTLDETWGRNWETSRFTLAPSLVDELWQDGYVDVFINIDADNIGHRVTLGQSTLTVAYSVGAIPEPATIGLLGFGGLLLLKRRRSQRLPSQ